MARYNVGGGNASDVAYGYPFMRQGAAVPGTWKDDATGSGTYGNGVTTKQADKDKLAAAFDPTDDNQYDFSKSAAQDWWIERGATGDNPDHHRCRGLRQLRSVVPDQQRLRHWWTQLR